MAAKAPIPPMANSSPPVFSSELLLSISILGSIAQTFDFPSWSMDTPRSTGGLSSAMKRCDVMEDVRGTPERERRKEQSEKSRREMPSRFLINLRCSTATTTQALRNRATCVRGLEPPLHQSVQYRENLPVKAFATPTRAMVAMIVRRVMMKV